MKQFIISALVFLFMVGSGISAQAQQQWTPKKGNGAFLSKVEQALDLTPSQMDFAKTALDQARTMTRAEFRNMSAAAKTAARTTIRSTFFDSLDSVLTTAQKAKLTAVRAKFS